MCPGDRVAILLHNRPEYLVLLQAVWRMGAVVVPINAKLHALEAAWIAADSGARVLVCEGEQAGALGAACQAAGAQPAIIPVDDLSALMREGPEGAAWSACRGSRPSNTRRPASGGSAE